MLKAHEELMTYICMLFDNVNTNNIKYYIKYLNGKTDKGIIFDTLSTETLSISIYDEIINSILESEYEPYISELFIFVNGKTFKIYLKSLSTLRKEKIKKFKNVNENKS
jgi:hypothetical protein